MVRVVRFLRWVLLFEGWLLLATPSAVLRWISHLEHYFPQAGMVFGHRGWFTFVCWTMGALCLATFWGQGKQKRWTRWTGLAVSLFNLAIFPPLGLTGLILMRRFARFHLPEDADQDTVTEESRNIRIARTCLMLVALALGYYWLDSYADSLGVTSPAFGWQTVVVMLCGQVIVSITHDLGHSAVAKILGFEFPVFRLGPWVWAKGESVTEWKSQINRLFAHDSYLSGIPRDAAHLRSNLLIAAAAGPVLSLLISLALFFAMMRSAGTALAQDGRLTGVLALLFALDFSINMLPFGFSDARVIVDLLARNRRGLKMIHQMVAAISNPPAHAASMAPPLVDPVAQRREALNRFLRRGVSGGLQLAQAHQELGIAEFLIGNSISAREHLDRSVELFAAFSNTLHKGRSWMWIEKMNRQKQLGVETHYAYGKAVQAWEAEKASAKNMENWAEARISLALLHLGQSELGTCMEELEQVETNLPRDPLLLGRYHHAAAACGFRMRWQDRSRQHALAAAQAFKNPKIPAPLRSMGVLYLADLASDMWLAGQTTLACDLLHDAITALSTCESPALTNHLRLLRAEFLAKTGNPDAASAEIAQLMNPDADRQRQVEEISGWIALARGASQEAAEHFDNAANTLDERERARLLVAAARALVTSGQNSDAATLARSACDVLIGEEHGEAGIALLLLSAQVYTDQPTLQNHPFFEEGRRIVRASRFQPLPDKLLALRDLVHLFDSINRPLESGELQEEMMWVLQQLTWETADMQGQALHESA